MKEAYVEIDAHKESNLLGCAFSVRNEAVRIGKVSADLNRPVAAIEKFRKIHEMSKEQLHICHEAGSTANC